MKKYRVTVNGTVYEIELEELTADYYERGYWRNEKYRI